MHETLLMLLLNLLQILLLYISTTSIRAAQADLPLVLINNNGELLYPNTITKGTFESGKGFKGDVRFSRDDNRDQIFLCSLSVIDDKKEIELANSLYNTNPRTKKLLGNVDVNFETCLKKQDFKKTEIARCSSKAEPVVYMKYDEENDTPTPIPCGPQNKGKMYKHVYNVCLPTTFSSRVKKYLSHIKSSDMREFYQKVPFSYEAQTVYEICLDSDNSNTIYTKHQLFSLPLLFDERLKNERWKTFRTENTYAHDTTTLLDLGMFNKQLQDTAKPRVETDEEGSYSDENSHLDEHTTSQGQRVERGYRKSPTKLPPRPQFEERFLVSPDDMPTAVLRKPCFHYVNVKAMHVELFGLWKKIEDTIRNTLKKHAVIYDVYTGAFKISTKRLFQKIPDIWVKIIYYDYKNPTMRNPGVAILMKNNITHGGQEVLLNSFCSTDHCELSQKEGLLRNFSYMNIKEMLRCCSLNQDIQDLFGLELKNNVILEIPGLTSAAQDVQT